MLRSVNYVMESPVLTDRWVSGQYYLWVLIWDTRLIFAAHQRPQTVQTCWLDWAVDVEVMSQGRCRLHLTSNSLIFVAHHSCSTGRTTGAPRGSHQPPAVDVNMYVINKYDDDACHCLTACQAVKVPSLLGRPDNWTADKKSLLTSSYGWWCPGIIRKAVSTGLGLGPNTVQPIHQRLALHSLLASQTVLICRKILSAFSQYICIDINTVESWQSSNRWPISEAESAKCIWKF